MQRGRCTAPGCGAVIGGESHVVAVGCKATDVSTIRVDGDDKGTKGYHTTEVMLHFF
jgi:hypothetical protein